MAVGRGRFAERPEVGAIFTRPEARGSAKGTVPGTLSFDVARWNHSRSAEILVSANRSADKNAAGYAGKTTQNGVAGHGTSSPYDIHNTLIAAGPDFREHATSAVPTSNVDLAPTMLKVLGLTVPSSMTGRVIEEGLRGGPAAGLIASRTRDRECEDRGRRLRGRRAHLGRGGTSISRLHGGQATGALTGRVHVGG